MLQSLLQKALTSNSEDLIRLAHRLKSHPLALFTPRDDNPDQFDEQSSFYFDRFPGWACVLAGNGAGKSYCASAKVAQFLDENPPPERGTPFWILSQTLPMVTDSIWGQNLSKFIPSERIADVVWYSKKTGAPKTVILKPHKNGNNYVLELKSYDQGREALQASNIIGCYLDEQCPQALLTEILARTRKWSYPGSKIYVLTPITPDPWLEECFNNPPNSWRFYRMNTRLNKSLDPDYVQRLEENELSELLETRLTGVFAHFAGAVYRDFGTPHVVEPFNLEPNWLRVRGLDTGFSHPLACVWAARDNEGRYIVYREYLEAQTSIENHVNALQSGWDEVRVKGPCYVDPANAQVCHEFGLRGLHTQSAHKDVLAGIACVQSLLRPASDGRPQLLIFNTCKQLISEMRNYCWNPKQPDKPLKVGDDLVDALRYLLFSHRMDSVQNYKALDVQHPRRKMPF